MYRGWIGAACGAALIMAALAVPVAAAPAVPAPLSSVENVHPDIVGGTPAAQGEFPWMVQLTVGCAGALIRPNIVLTAAHCVGPSGPDSSIGAILNTVDLQRPGAIRTASNYVYRVPEFGGIGTPDWALVRLESSFTVPTLQLAVKPAYDNGTFTIAGWGATASGGPGELFLRKAQVPFVSDSLCSLMYGPYVSSTMICAGPSAGGADACDGDSGAPLFRRNPSNKWIAIGITSWSGAGCGVPNRPRVYTQISAFAREIQNWANALSPNPCGDVGCTTLSGAYISHYTGLDCFGTESFYTPYASGSIRWSWDGGGIAGVTKRTVTNRSWRDADGVCRNSWPNGNTLSGFVTIYRHPCGESSCTVLGGAYISHYTGLDCTGTEGYYTPYFGDGIRRSWDGGGIAGAVTQTLTTRSWRGTDMTCHNDWPGGNTLSGLVRIYR